MELIDSNPMRKTLKPKRKRKIRKSLNNSIIKKN